MLRLLAVVKHIAWRAGEALIRGDHKDAIVPKAFEFSGDWTYDNFVDSGSIGNINCTRIGPIYNLLDGFSLGEADCKQ